MSMADELVSEQKKIADSSMTPVPIRKSIEEMIRSGVKYLVLKLPLWVGSLPNRDLT